MRLLYGILWLLISTLAFAQSDAEYGPTAKSYSDLGIPSSFSTTHNVSSLGQLNAALAACSAGHAIVLANGSYDMSGVTIPSSCDGTSGNEVWMYASTPGGATLSGGGELNINADYFVIAGVKNKIRTDINGHDVRLLWNDYSGPRVRTVVEGSQFGFVMVVYGDDAEIAHSTFDFPNDGEGGQIMVFDQSYHNTNATTSVKRPWVHHNTLKNITALESQTNLIAGYSFAGDNPPSGSDEDMLAIFENNLMIQTYGDWELVSLKSNRNIFRNNCMLDNDRGIVTVRMGDGNLIYGNRVGQAQNSGVAISGHDNVVAFNHFSGKGNFWAMELHSRGQEAAPLHPWANWRYNSADDNLISSNIFDNFNSLYRIYSPAGAFLDSPSGNTIEKNHFRPNSTNRFRDDSGVWNETQFLNGNIVRNNITDIGVTEALTACDQPVTHKAGDDPISLPLSYSQEPSLTQINPPSWWGDEVITNAAAISVAENGKGYLEFWTAHENEGRWYAVCDNSGTPSVDQIVIGLGADGLTADWFGSVESKSNPQRINVDGLTPGGTYSCYVNRRFDVVTEWSQEQFAELKAAPGLVGWATETAAGRGGDVLVVTSLADSGPGSFREALAACHKRQIVFSVAGIIQLTTGRLQVFCGDVSVYGQTAPGNVEVRAPLHDAGGVLGYDSAIDIYADNVLMQYLTFRTEVATDNGANNCCRDVVNLGRTPVASGTKNIVLDHLSIQGGNDETLDSWYGTHRFTVSNSIIGEGAYQSNHVSGQAHSMAALFGDGARQITLHRNLFANAGGRNPQLQDVDEFQLTNNIISGYGRGTEIQNLTGRIGGGACDNNAVDSVMRGDIIDNLYIDPQTTWGEMIFQDSCGGSFQIYANGNGWQVGAAIGGARMMWGGGNGYNGTVGSVIPEGSRFETFIRLASNPDYPTISSFALRDAILGTVGNSKYRDEFDQRIIDQVNTQTGGFIDCINGHESLPANSSCANNVTWPITHVIGTTGIDASQVDGISNDVKALFGLPANADTTQLFDDDGYSYFEKIIYRNFVP